MMKQILKSITLVGIAISLVGCTSGKDYYDEGNQMIVLANDAAEYIDGANTFYDELWELQENTQKEQLAQRFQGTYTERMEQARKRDTKISAEENIRKAYRADQEINSYRLIAPYQDQIDKKTLEVLAATNEELAEYIKTFMETPVADGFRIAGGKFGDYLISLNNVGTIKRADYVYEGETVNFLDIQGQVYTMKNERYKQLQETLETEDFLITNIFYADATTNQYETIMLENAFYSATNVENLQWSAPLQISIPTGVAYMVYLDKENIDYVRFVAKRQKGVAITDADLEPLEKSMELMGIGEEDRTVTLESLIHIMNNTNKEKVHGKMGEYSYRFNKVPSRQQMELLEIVID